MRRRRWTGTRKETQEEWGEKGKEQERHVKRREIGGGRKGEDHGEMKERWEECIEVGMNVDAGRKRKGHIGKEGAGHGGAAIAEGIC